MLMKRNWIILLGCLLWTINANALIVSVNGHGDIPEEGMEITLSEAKQDPLTDEMMVEVNGTLLCDEPLTVTIRRSAADTDDEFCCAGVCQVGNGQTEETIHYTPSGIATWFAHFSPADTFVTVVYTFSTATESLVLTVHYNVTQGLDEVQSENVTCTKFIRNGLLFIQNGDKIYHL